MSDISGESSIPLDPLGIDTTIDAAALPAEIDPVEIDPAVHAVTALPGPRFCRICGTAWQAEWTECGACVARLARRASASLLPADILSSSGVKPLEDGGVSSIKNAVALYFTLLAICAAGLIASLAHAPALGTDITVTVCLSFAVLVWAVFVRRDVMPPLRRVPHVGWIGAGVGTAFVTFGVAVGVMKLIGWLVPSPEVHMSDPYIRGGYGWGAVVLAIAVQPAIIEELAFRGIINGSLARALGPVETVFVGAMMFMILHLSPARFPHTMAMGLAAGFLRTRTGSLYPCMAMHFTHNFLCVIMEWAGK
jgi:membrane protease YdiL (CAAX protease family)